MSVKNDWISLDEPPPEIFTLPPSIVTIVILILQLHDLRHQATPPNVPGPAAYPAAWAASQWDDFHPSRPKCRIPPTSSRSHRKVGKLDVKRVLKVTQSLQKVLKVFKNRHSHAKALIGKVNQFPMLMCNCVEVSISYWPNE